MVQEIPVEFQDWRFVLCLPNQKKAFEKNWETTANYSYGDPRLKEHLAKGGNYGILAGDGHVIIETDTPTLEKLVEENFPKTLTQRSPGHNSKHFFYNGKVSKTIPLFDKSLGKDRKNIGHVKTGASYVMGPGCVHPNGGKYEFADHIPIAPAPTEEQLKAVLGKFMAKRAWIVEERQAVKHGPQVFSIMDLAPRFGKMQQHGDQLQGPHPVHGSETGTNFCVNPRDNVWYCFRCNSGGGPYSLLAVLEGIIECEDAIPGQLRGDLFKQTREKALELELIKKPMMKLSNADGEKPTLTEDAQPHEVSNAILQTFRIATLQDDDTMMVYDKGKYIEGGEGIVSKIIEADFHKAEIDQVSNNHFVSEVLGHVKRRTYTNRNMFDQDAAILNLANGLLNVETGSFKPHDPDYYSCVQLPVKWDPDAKTDKIQAFMGQILDPGDIPTVQEFIGAILWKAHVKKALMLIGEGDNGKSTLIGLLKNLLGPENVAARSLQELEGNRFAKADLYGKLANLYSDLPATALKTTGTFKLLTGGDPVTAEHKFGQPFTFVPYDKQIYSANIIPEAPDDTPAFFGRWLIIKFPNAFPEGDPRRNPRLLAELSTPENLSGFLNWALEGLARLRKNDFRFTAGKTTDATREEYKRRSNPVHAFLEEYCKLGPELEVQKDKLYRAYVEFCGANSFHALQIAAFYTRLVGKFETTRHKQPDGKQPVYLTGLTLRTSQEREEWKTKQRTLDDGE